MVVEPTKVCSSRTCPRADERQPWSNFYAKVKWPNGRMRQPQSRCKVCQARALRLNREPQRRYDRKRYARVRNDPAAWANRLEEQRFNYRGRCGVSHVSRRRDEGLTLDPAPIADWLRHVMDRDGASIRVTAARLGIGEKTMREILKERQRVRLDTVERVLMVEGDHLREVYESWYREAA